MLDDSLIKHLNINKIFEFYEKFSHEDLNIELKNDALKNKNYIHNQNFNLPNIITKQKIFIFLKKTKPLLCN